MDTAHQNRKTQIGPKVIDTLYGHYLNMWDELSDRPGRHVSGPLDHCGKGSRQYGRDGDPTGQQPSTYAEMSMKGSVEDRKRWSRTARTVYVPLPLFFTRASGSALPLVAISSQVTIGISLNNLNEAILNFSTKAADSGLETNLYADNNLFGSSQNNAIGSLFESTWTTIVRQRSFSDTSQASLDTMSFPLCTSATSAATFSGGAVAITDLKLTLQVGFVYLNISERSKFTTSKFDILIEQVTTNTTHIINSATPGPIKPSFIYIVLDMMWAFTRKCIRREPLDYTGRRDFVAGTYTDPLKTVQLRLNNATRFNQQNGLPVSGRHFRTVEPYLYHTRIPNNYVYMYSFALNPEGQQPSGSINMTRVDDVKMELTLASNLEVGTAVELQDTFSREAAHQNAGDTDAQTASRALHKYRATNLKNANISLHWFARRWNVLKLRNGSATTIN